MRPSRPHPRELATTLSRRAGQLCDGRRTLAYGEVQASVARLEAWLDAHAGEGVIWFECDNSVPSLLMLLALFARERSFVLVPPPRPGAELPLPSFCRWRLSSSSGEVGLDALEGAFALAQVPDHRPPSPEAQLERGRLLLRTSGSVGTPKLVVHTHEGVLANADNAVERLDLQADDRVLIPVPVAHMFGLGAALLPALLVGASVEVIAGANILKYLERERAFEPRVAFSTPNLCAMLSRPRPVPHYRHIVVAGDKLSPELFSKLEGIHNRVVNLYGSTELGVICATDARETEGPRATTVGRPLPGVELELRREDPEAGEGELLCRHPFAFEGYVDTSGARLASSSEPEFRTRDLARIDDAGLVELLGRCDHAVKRDGRLVLLTEVERALERLDAVARAAVVVAGQTRRGRGLVAFCLPSAGDALDPDQVRDAARELLPAYALPDHILELDALPTLASGKMDRRALQSQLPIELRE